MFGISKGDLSFKVSFVMIGSADWKLHGDNRKTDNRDIILEKITLFWTKFLGFSEVFWAKLYEETATRSG